MIAERIDNDVKLMMDQWIFEIHSRINSEVIKFGGI